MLPYVAATSWPEANVSGGSCELDAAPAQHRAGHTEAQDHDGPSRRLGHGRERYYAAIFAAAAAVAALA